MKFRVSATRARLAGMAVATFIFAVGCRGGGGSDSSPTAPSGSGGTAPTTGTWTGTIARPGAVAPITVRWEASTNPAVDYQITGPMTLTNGGTSVSIRGIGNTAGNDRNGYTIHMQLTANQGEIAGFPTCSIQGSTVSSQGGDPFPQPYNRIVVPAIDMSYGGCSGFIEDPLRTNSLRETVQLTLTK